MRVLIRLNKDTKFATKITGAVAGWEDREKRTSFLTVFGEFKIPNEKPATSYTMHFKTDLGISLCKKLEKEGTADLSTDYVVGFTSLEEFGNN